VGRLGTALRLAVFLALGGLARAAEADVDLLVARMQAAYAGVEDYRTQVTSTVREAGQEPEETRFLYRFRRPNRIRIDFSSPHPGTTLVYPTTAGKVRIRPGGLFRFLRISLDPGSASLEVAPGQRIDQTDLGFLVRNITRSLTDSGSTEISLRYAPEAVVASVVAENHFQAGVRTRYEFWVNRRLWLPVRLRETVPEREWEREVSFEDLETNLGLPESLFHLE